MSSKKKKVGDKKAAAAPHVIDDPADILLKRVAESAGISLSIPALGEHYNGYASELPPISPGTFLAIYK